MENSVLVQETLRLYNEASSKGVHFTIIRAELTAFQLENCRLAVNDFDLFASLVQRPYLGNWQYTGAMPQVLTQRYQALAEERPSAVDGYYRAQLDLSHTSPDWDAILTLGIPGLLKRAEERFRETPCVFTEAVVIVYKAFRKFAMRAVLLRQYRRAVSTGNAAQTADSAPKTVSRAPCASQEAP